MGEYKTPGACIKEQNAFGYFVNEAETAIPAFIGCTEATQNGAEKNKPQKISSMTEFVKYFGGAPKLEFEVDIIKYDAEPKGEGDSKVCREGMSEKPVSGIFKYITELSEKENDTEVKNGYAFSVDGDKPYTLYYNMVLFFANGGETCYVVSVGDNLSSVPDAESLKKGINTLDQISEITMVIIPDAVNLMEDEIKDVQTAMLFHCGGKMKNRIALLDVQPAGKEETLLKQIETFQSNIGSDYLSFGVAYHPWLNTSVLAERDLDGSMFKYKDPSFFDSYLKLAQIDSNFTSIISEFLYPTIIIHDQENITLKGYTFIYNKDFNKGDSVIVKDENGIDIKIGEIATDQQIDPTNKTKSITIKWYLNNNEKQKLHQALLSSSILYKLAIRAILAKLNLLPPSAAMAGIYTMVDKSRGVWKAPANVTLNDVYSPAVYIDNDEQVVLNGKAINVIRTFIGEGAKVCGARTLDGNSLDWCYVNVRRTRIFIEETIKNSTRECVFEPNDAVTWINMKCLIENFLRSVWKRGGLAGATLEDAFEVHIGLGDTMTADDILDGIMRIKVLVAVTHPAEFMEITFQLQMQKS